MLCEPALQGGDLTVPIEWQKKRESCACGAQPAGQRCCPPSTRWAWPCCVVICSSPWLRSTSAISTSSLRCDISDGGFYLRSVVHDERSLLDDGPVIAAPDRTRKCATSTASRMTFCRPHSASAWPWPTLWSWSLARYLEGPLLGRRGRCSHPPGTVDATRGLAPSKPAC